jgi:hypothetical protein
MYSGPSLVSIVKNVADPPRLICVREGWRMAILWDRDMVNCPGLRPFKEVREVYDCSTECVMMAWGSRSYVLYIL